MATTAARDGARLSVRGEKLTLAATPMNPKVPRARMPNARSGADVRHVRQLWPRTTIRYYRYNRATCATRAGS